MFGSIDFLRRIDSAPLTANEVTGSRNTSRARLTFALHQLLLGLYACCHEKLALWLLLQFLQHVFRRWQTISVT